MKTGPPLPFDESDRGSRAAWCESQSDAGSINGPYRSLHLNESIASSGFVRGGQRDGYWEFYDGDGRKVSEGPYRNGDRSGSWLLYLPSGHRIGRIFDGDLPSGASRTWNAEGCLIAEETFESGKLEGMKRLWDNDGFLRAEFSFQEGAQEGEQKWFFRNGEVSQVATAVNGELEGEATLYFETGALKATVGYKHSLFQGEAVFLRRDGKRSKVETYTAGKLTSLLDFSDDDRGVPLSCDPPDRLRKESVRDDDGDVSITVTRCERRTEAGAWVAHGPEIIWRRDSEKILQGRRRLGEKHGEWVYYDGAGRVEKIETFSDTPPGPADLSD